MATANELLRLARTRIGDPYHLGALVPKSNPNWHGPWDCAEFASWCVFQITGKLFGCRPRSGNPDEADAYTGFWNDDAKAIGTVITVGQAAATPGAFLLRIGQGNTIGHIVIAAGDGRTVEAASTKLGVIEGKSDGRTWHIGILVPDIDVTVGEPEPPQRPALVLTVKTPRMKGELVQDVQRALNKLGFHPGPNDGVFGSQCGAAVQAFQVSKGLVPDGAVGSVTAKALGVTWP